MLDKKKKEIIKYINNLTSSYIYAKYPLENQLRIKTRLIELSMLCSDNKEEIDKLQNKLNWISAILDIGKSVKIAINLSINELQIQNIIEDYKQLLNTL